LESWSWRAGAGELELESWSWRAGAGAGELELKSAWHRPGNWMMAEFG